MSEEQTERVVWAKDCECRARATTNETRMTVKFNNDTGKYNYIYALYPMPSCDLCGKPWKTWEQEAAPRVCAEGDAT